MPRDRILLGTITGAHGIRGEVLIRSHTEDPLAIAAYGPLADKAGGRTFELSGVRAGAKGIIARIAGITDRNAAERLKGTDLYIERHCLPEPEDGEFYHADLIGLSVVTPEGDAVGEVVAIQNFGAGDLLEYRPRSSKRTELLPFDKTFVPEVDLAAGRVTVILPAESDD